MSIEGKINEAARPNSALLPECRIEVAVLVEKVLAFELLKERTKCDANPASL